VVTIKEKNMQLLFSAYIKANPPQRTEVYELKIVKGRSLPFKQVADHQVEALVDAASSKGCYHKINDAPIYGGMKTRFTNPKPFDCQFICRAKAYLVIWFYKPRQKKRFYLIDIFEWNRCKAIWGEYRKSATEEMIASMAKEVKD